MLVLTRKRGQVLRIGPVTVAVHSTERNRVKLAIEAPDDFVITRPEVHPNPERNPAKTEHTDNAKKD